MSQPKGYVDPHYLQALAGLIKPIKQRSYELMQLQPEQRLLDVGCGPGIDTVVLGQIVGKTGKVIGIDLDATMIAEADMRARQAGVDTFVRHQQGDATSLPFESDWFDACRSERLFMHLLHPDQALQEMIRVTKAGGRLVVADPDWGSVSMDTFELEVERQLARVGAERALNNGYSGRCLFRLFKEHRLTDVSLEIFPLHSTDLALWRYLARQDEVEEKAVADGIYSREDLQHWRTTLQQADRRKVFFASVNMIMISGRLA